MQIANHPHYEKAKYWGKLVTVTGCAQILVQAIGVICGILVVRLLPEGEYALYTLANTMLGTMTVLSDGGISTGVMAQGGKVWQDKKKLGAVLATGMDLRRKFAIFSLIVSLPILGYLLMHHGASWIMTILIAASLIPAFYASLSDNLLQIPVKLHQAISPLQQNEAKVSIGRLILTGLTLFAFPWAFVAIMASGIPRIWGNVRLRKITGAFVEADIKADVEERKEIVKGMKKLLPDAIYYCVSGQITIWLLSVLGTTTSIAEIGALARISALLNIFSAILTILVVPRFARCGNKKRILWKNFSIVILPVLIVLVLTLLTTQFFSDPILMILGENYQGLNDELVLSVINACILVVAGLFFGILTAKSWVANPVWTIITNVVFIIAGVFIFDVSSLVGALKFGIFTSISLLLVRGVNFYCKIIKLRE